MAQLEEDEDDQAPASDAPLAVAAPSSAASGASETAPASAPDAATAVTTASGSSFAPASAHDLAAGPRGPVQLQLQRLAAVMLTDALYSELDGVGDRPACSGGPLTQRTALGQRTFGTVFRCAGLEAAAKVFRYESREDAW